MVGGRRKGLFLKVDKGAVEGDLVGLACGTGDEVLLGKVLIELATEGTTDGGNVFTGSVAGGVAELGDGEDAFVFVEAGVHLAVDDKELTEVVTELFEADAIGIAEEEEVEGLADGGELDLKVVVGQEEAIVGGDDKAGELVA